MATIYLDLKTKDGNSQYYQHRLAGHALLCDSQIAELSPYFLGNSWEMDKQVELTDLCRNKSGEFIVYTGPGWIGNQWREIECFFDASGYRLHVPGLGDFSVSSDGNQILTSEINPQASQQNIVETVLGPALVLALALHGTWCLHASAALLDERLVMFTGESGSGKSTLAAFLDGGGDLRVSDDILPVELQDRTLNALPHFPQLKLSHDQQPAGRAPERLHIDAMYLIHPLSKDENEVKIRRLGHKEASLALVRHTVAARLFEKALLTKHLEFCVQAAENTRVYELSYPHNLELLPSVRGKLREHLRG